MKPENPASTPVEELQRQREKRELERAKQRSTSMHQQLVGKGKEGRTSYGALLMDRYAETLSTVLDELLGRLLSNPSLAGPYFSYWPLLLNFCNRGPRSIAAITLGVVLDQISRPLERNKLAQQIGRALQDENTAGALRDQHGAVLFEQLRKRYGRTAIKADRLRQLYVDPQSWTLPERRGVGNFLLALIASNTDLIRIEPGKVEIVSCTDATRELIRSEPPRPLPVRALPSVVRLERWTGPRRGNRNLVVSRAPLDRTHLSAETLATAVEVVNVVEQQELVIDPWMVQVQREAWDGDIPGLFPVRRNPEGRFSLQEEVYARCRIEEAIRQGEEVAGLPIWLEHDMDFRGRLYCSSRMAGHQGPDHQKALLMFAQRERMDDDAFEQLLAAAAGHYGLGHASWEERVQWGRAHLDQMDATAKHPLDRSDLWKAAADPWQHLQACKAISDFLADESQPSGCPVRFDQTASGMGIIGALTRDEALCRHTNVVGKTRHDLYAFIAERLLGALRMDLDGFDLRDQRLAEFWLQKPIGRDLAKGPTLTTIYGARHFGLVEQVVSWLQEENPDVPVRYWQKEYTRPAQYLAQKLNLVIAAELKSCVALDKWLRAVSTKCIKKQERIRWMSPLDFPLAFGSLLGEKQNNRTLLHGNRRWQHVNADVEPGELSARATNRGIVANTIHAFDAALVHAVVLRCGIVHAPVLTNHDCFATIPSRAAWLHSELLSQFRQLYAPDWLSELRVEISRNAGVQLPHPPHVGTLRQGAIGENPYCFC